MEIKPHNKRFLEAPFPEGVEQFYTAKFLISFGERFLEPLFPELAAREKVRKRDVTAVFGKLHKDEAKLRQLVDSFPPKLREAIGILLWESSLTIKELEERLGMEVARPLKSRPRSIHDLAFELDEDLELLAHGLVSDFYSRYSLNPGKDQFQVSLPGALRTLFKKVYPVPEYYNWVPLTPRKDRKKELMRFNCETAVATDLVRIADFLKRGNLKVTQAGKVSVASLRSLAGLTVGGEFFPGSKASRKLPEMRHQILLDAVRKWDPAFSGLLTEEPFPGEAVFGQLPDQLFGKGSFLLETVLPHLKLSHYYHDARFKKKSLDTLKGLFASLPPGEWVSSENLAHYPFYREMDILFFNYNDFCFRPDPKSPAGRQCYYYGDKIEVDADTVNGVVTLPLLFGTAFLLAGLGLLEIEYLEPPKHPLWRVKGESFLSPFDGLVGLRMTSLGAFAFGRTSQLDLAPPQESTVRVTLHPERLMATCKGAEPLTLAAMGDFMERLAPGIYRLTAQSLFKGCTSKKDLEERIRAFRQRIPATIPPFWEAAFKEFLGTPPPLTCENAYFVYRIGDDPALRKHFATDPVLLAQGLKVEGWRIALTPEEHKRVRERLRALGYLVETDSSTIAPSRAASGRKLPPRRRRY